MYECKLHIDARMILDPLMIGLGLNMSKAKSWVDFEAMPLDRQKSCLEATFHIVRNSLEIQDVCQIITVCLEKCFKFCDHFYEYGNL